MNLRTKYQDNLLSKADFDNELISFNRNITSNKTKEVRKKKKKSNNKILFFSSVELILYVMMNLEASLFINQHLRH